MTCGVGPSHRSCCCPLVCRDAREEIENMIVSATCQRGAIDPDGDILISTANQPGRPENEARNDGLRRNRNGARRACPGQSSARKAAIAGLDERHPESQRCHCGDLIANDRPARVCGSTWALCG